MQTNLQQIIKFNYKKSEQILDLYCKPGILLQVLQQINGQHQKIKILKLYKCEIDDSCLQKLCQCNFQNLRKLQKIHLYGNVKITDKGAINTVKFFEALKGIYLGDFFQQRSNITDNFVSQMMAVHSNWQIIGIMNSNITHKCFRSFLEQTGNLKIKQLILSKNNLGNQGGILLSRINMEKLSRLDVDQCQIGDQGIKSIMKANWTTLQNINLSDNPFNINAIQKLPWGRWSKLKKFDIHGSSLYSPMLGLALVREASPNVKFLVGQDSKLAGLVWEIIEATYVRS